MLVLAGWFLDQAELKSLNPVDGTPMVANSAICFFAAGLCLFLLCQPASPLWQGIIRVLSVFIASIGAATLLEYALNINIGLDELLVKQRELISSHPGRMSLVSAINFVIVGTAIWIETQPWRRTKLVFDYVMLTCLFTTLYPFTGTLFGAVHVNSQNTNMAISSAIGFFLFTAAYFVRHSDRGWASLVVAPGTAGVLIRGILMPLAILYPLIAFLTVQGEKAGLYNTEGSMVFMMVTSLALFTTIVLITAQAISRLDNEKDQYKKFFALSSELLLIAGGDGSIRLASAAFTRAMGHLSSEGDGKSFFYYVHPDDTQKIVGVFDRLREDPNPESLQLQMRNKEGHYGHFLWSFTRENKSGDVYAAGYDITEIKEAQQVRALAGKLQLQNQQLASFAHIVSHNLRSHVGNLSSLLHLHKGADAAEQAVLLGMVEKVTHHLGGTLADLIESIRIQEADKKERNEIFFAQVLNKVKEVLSTPIAEAKAEIIDTFEVEFINYPGVYLESILLNLISNAVKYRSPDRPLIIRVESKRIQDQVILLVADNGLGIDLDRYGDKLFGFYKTFHPSKEAKGLGLFITKAQVEAMGGTISAESKVDQGTTFRVAFGLS